jgi:hypothetical protein
MSAGAFHESSSDLEGLYGDSSSGESDGLDRKLPAPVSSEVTGETLQGSEKDEIQSTEGAETASIRVKFLEKEVKLSVQLGNTVAQFRDLLRTEHLSEIDFTTQRLRLIHAGRVLSEDSKTLWDYGVQGNSVIHATLSPLTNTPGGNDAPPAPRDNIPNNEFMLPGSNPRVQIFVGTREGTGGFDLNNFQWSASTGPAGIQSTGLFNLAEARPRTECTHILEPNTTRGRNWVCDRCNIDGADITMNCQQCDFDLCVTCYAQDVAIARTHSSNPRQGKLSSILFPLVLHMAVNGGNWDTP